MDRAQCLNNFWNSFYIQAYDSNTVPQNAAYPRITYEVSLSDFNAPVLLTASIWYNSTSWAQISQKADEIETAIGKGGITLPYDNGLLWIVKGTPFSQRMSDEDPNIRRIVINIEAEYIE